MTSLIPSHSRSLACRWVQLALLGGLLCVPLISVEAQTKKVLLIAGSRSHGAGEHEFKAGCHLLKSCLQGTPGLSAEVATDGWPSSEAAFQGVDAIVIYSDGGSGHPAIQADRLKTLRGLMAKGVGLGCVHYGVEVPKGESGDAFLDWIGGYFEMFWSVNPHWTAQFNELPQHEILRGVKPFHINDEWYYHMRFRPEMKGVTPLLTALPPAETLNRPDGPHSGNPAVRASVAKGEKQPLMWCVERADGGRGFGFTGGHFHKNWQEENFRKVTLNAILWISKMPVPEKGVFSELAPGQIQLNLDVKK